MLNKFANDVSPQSYYARRNTSIALWGDDGKAMPDIVESLNKVERVVLNTLA